jgi:MFS family permease
VRRARWTILLVPALLYFISYFQRVAPAVVAGDLMAAFAVSAAALGTLSAVYPYCFAAMALPGGSLADVLGPRGTLTLGGLSMGGGAILFGLAPAFGVAFAGRLLVGLGASVMLIASLRLAAEWFRTN